MRFFFVAWLVLVPGIVGAVVAVETDQSQPYEVVPVEATPGEARLFLGELTGYPIMYEVASDNPFIFTAQVRQLSQREQEPFSLILIRQNDRGGGVTEVARMNIAPDDWQRARDNVLGLSLNNSPTISEPVDAGIYRVEISTPENHGTYVLAIGDTPAETGYGERLASVRQVQQWFGLGVFGMLGSRLVYQPLIILLLLGMVYKIWQYRHLLRPVSSHEST